MFSEHWVPVVIGSIWVSVQPGQLLDNHDDFIRDARRVSVVEKSEKGVAAPEKCVTKSGVQYVVSLACAVGVK